MALYTERVYRFRWQSEFARLEPERWSLLERVQRQPDEQVESSGRFRVPRSANFLISLSA